MQYITATHLLEHLHETLVVNNPQKCEMHLKSCLCHFPELIPPTLISRDMAEIKSFRREYGDIIVKPLLAMAASAVHSSAPG